MASKLLSKSKVLRELNVNFIHIFVVLLLQNEYRCIAVVNTYYESEVIARYTRCHPNGT